MPKIDNMGRKKSSIGCLFWTALVLLVLVVFLFNRNTIESVIDKTGLLTYIKKDRPVIEQPVIERVAETVEETEESEQEETPPSTTDDTQVAEPIIENIPETEIVVSEEELEPEKENELPVLSKKIRRSQLFFVYVDSGGKVSLKSVVRPVYYIDSPLTDTLNSLLNGLSADEISSGLLSLVPAGTQIQGIRIQSGTAFIDFNESFRFNSFGGEGYRSQLQQIVFTATEFQTVKAVQFLVNGERLSYLGPESPYIGEPLYRESL
jgi:germination protein M